MERIWDTLIAGGGPAGLTAGLYCARAGLRVLLLEGVSPGGQLLLTDTVENYPGTGPISGHALAERMRDQAQNAGMALENAWILRAELSGPHKTLETEMGHYFAKSVILALGASPKKLGLPEEARLLGRGVSYCALCDGFFFRGKTVCVIGGGNSAAEEALYLSRLCREVYVVHRRNHFTAQKPLWEKLERTANITLFTNRVIRQIQGKEQVEGVVLQDLSTQTQEALPCDGVFVAIGRAPNTSFLPEALAKDPQGYLYTDDKLATSLPGVFAAGDIRRKSIRQIVTAVSDGALAAAAAEGFLKNP